MFGVAIGGEAAKRVDRGQPGVAGADATAAVAFEVIEESAHQRGIEIPELELRRFLSGLSFRIREKQPEGVSIGVDRVGTDVALGAEASGEESLQTGGECGHGRFFLRPAARALASARSSGTADKYQ